MPLEQDSFSESGRLLRRCESVLIDEHYDEGLRIVEKLIKNYALFIMLHTIIKRRK